MASILGPYTTTGSNIQYYTGSKQSFIDSPEQWHTSSLTTPGKYFKSMQDLGMYNADMQRANDQFFAEQRAIYDAAKRAEAEKREREEREAREEEARREAERDKAYMKEHFPERYEAYYGEKIITPPKPTPPLVITPPTPPLTPLQKLFGTDVTVTPYTAPPPPVPEPKPPEPTYVLPEEIKKKIEIEEKAPVIPIGTVITPMVGVMETQKEIQARLAREAAAVEKVEKVVAPVLEFISKPAEKVLTAAEKRRLEESTFAEIQPYAPEVGATGFIVPSEPIPSEKLARDYPFLGPEMIQKRIEDELRIKATQYQLDAQNTLRDKYIKELETESVAYVKQYDKYIKNGAFTGTQEQYNQYVKDFDRQQKLNEQLVEHVNTRYSKEVNKEVTSNLSKDIKLANEDLERLTTISRRYRAAELAPFVLLESYILGGGVRAGIGLAAKIAPALGTAVGVGVTAAFVAPIIATAPAIVTSFKADPLSFVLETVPVVTGFALGAGAVNPQMMKGLKTKAKSFIDFEKKLAADKKAFFEQFSGMSRIGQKQLLQTRFKTLGEKLNKQKYTYDDLKYTLKKTSVAEIRQFVENQKKIIDRSTKSPAEKLKAKERLAAVVLEARTDISIFNEFGVINKAQLTKAVTKARGVYEITGKPKVEVKPVVKPLEIKPVDIIKPKVTVKPKAIEIFKPKVEVKPVIKPIDIFKPIIKPKVAVKPKVIPKVAAISLIAPVSILKAIEVTKEKEALKVAAELKAAEALKVKEELKLAPLLKVEEVAKVEEALKPLVIQKPIGFLAPVPVSPFRPISRPEPPRLRLPRPIIGWPRLPKPKIKVEIRRKLIKRRVRVQPGYNVYGKPIKQKTYRKLNKVPLTQTKARDLGAYIADHSLSASFKLKPSSKKAQTPKTRIPIGYYSRTKRKFRDYRIVKKKRKPMKDKWIERRGLPRLDTRGEKQKIKMMRKLAEVRKRPLKKKRRKKR
jgi:hypothetical protein